MTAKYAPPTFRLMSQGAVNLAGQVVPLAFAVFTIPVLLQGLGTERFGFLSLAWLMVGYFTIFDLGLGRALTQLIAIRLGGDLHGLRSVIRTGLVAMSVLGVVGAVIATVLTPMLVQHVFKVSTALGDEGLIAFYLLALTVPIVILSTGLIGILTAYGRFGLVNWVRIPLGIAGYIVPVATIRYTHNLGVVVALLCFSRLVALIVLWLMCRRVTHGLPRESAFEGRQLAALFRFGGWMTVTNVIGPVMTYLDRFLVGSVVSVAAVAYYATPFQIIGKLVMVPNAISGVLFPAFAVALGRKADHGAVQQAGNEMHQLVDSGWRYIGLSMFPMVLMLVCFGREGLELWLGDEFAENGSAVLQLLALGVFVNAIAYIPFTLIESAGRADLTAKLHLLELPLYVGALFAALKGFGIEGAAAVWTLRFTLDGVCLLLIARRLVPDAQRALTRAAAFMIAGIMALIIIMVIEPLATRAIAGGITLLLGTALALHYQLVPPLRGIRKALGTSSSAA